MNQTLAPEILQRVRAIPPSRDGKLSYYPCTVLLQNGTARERVYMIDADAYARTWGLIPDRTTVTASEIVSVDESPERLPPAFADALYAAGESGMGYCIFTLRFRDGAEQAYLTGNAVDFLQFPNGREADDVVAVLPHRGRESQSRLDGLSYEWCPVSGLATAP